MPHHLIDHAIRFAAEAHAGQRRKEPRNGFELPYITHPLEVLKTVWTWGAADGTTGPAAVLHDVVEDCGVPLATIEEEFGRPVAAFVGQLTFVEGGDKLGYLLSFKDPARTAIEALVVKVADRICNVQDYAPTNPTYAAKYLKKAAALSDAIAERFDEIAARWNPETAASLRDRWQSLWNRVVG